MYAADERKAGPDVFVVVCLSQFFRNRRFLFESVLRTRRKEDVL